MVFIDEPESALHPVAITKLIEIIVSLADSGIQFFIASHSYFVIKALYLAAQNRRCPFRFCHRSMGIGLAMIYSKACRTIPSSTNPFASMKRKWSWRWDDYHYRRIRDGFGSF